VAPVDALEVDGSGAGCVEHEGVPAFACRAPHEQQERVGEGLEVGSGIKLTLKFDEGKQLHANNRKQNHDQQQQQPKTSHSRRRNHNSIEDHLQLLRPLNNPQDAEDAQNPDDCGLCCYILINLEHF